MRDLAVIQDLDSSSEGSRVLDDASLVASTPGRLAVTDGPLAVPGKRQPRQSRTGSQGGAGAMREALGDGSGLEGLPPPRRDAADLRVQHRCPVAEHHHGVGFGGEPRVVGNHYRCALWRR